MSAVNDGSESNESSNLPPRSPSVRKGHRRQASHPSTAISAIDMSPLARQWSTGVVPVGGYESASNIFTGLPTTGPMSQPESIFHATWSNMGSVPSPTYDYPSPQMNKDDSIRLQQSQSFASTGSFSTQQSSTVPSTSIPPDGPSMPDILSSSITVSHDPNMPTSRIHDEARVTAWDNVLDLCRSSPKDAGYVDPGGWTALHHACNRRCHRTDVVEALVKACPQALLDLEEKDWTPLHYACRFKAPEDTVHLLLHLFPKFGHLAVSKRDREGRTPLWYAVRYDAPDGVVEMLLDIDPSVVLVEDLKGESPLEVCWDNWAEKTDGKKVISQLLSELQTEGREETLTERKSRLFTLLQSQKKLYAKWQMAVKLLRAHFKFPLSQEKTPQQQQSGTASTSRRTFRVLHATAAIRCHPTLFHVAKALYPEQASEFDDNDLKHQDGSGRQTALHIACGSCAKSEAGRSIISSLLELNPQAAEYASGGDGSLPLHKLVENEHKSHFVHDGIRDVYQRFPAALVKPDACGMLPLHRAAAANKSGGGEGGSVISHLVQLHADAANVRDATGRLPLHYVAERGESWEEEAEEIYNAHQAGVRARAGTAAENRLPLHLAALSPDARRSLLEKLVELNPQATQQADRQGKLPLHLACESGKQWDKGISCIYEAFEGAIQQPEQNDRQWVALQIASASPSSLDSVVCCLVEQFPEAASLRDERGQFPLHLACEAGKKWDSCLRTIFDANPFANSTADNNGLMPFHIAALRYCDQQGSPTNNANDDDDAVQDDDDLEDDDVPDRTEFLARSRSTSITEPPPAPQSAPDNDASKVEVLFQLLLKDPTILSIY